MKNSMILFMVLALGVLTSNAQEVFRQPLGPASAKLTLDTVTNAATNFLTSPRATGSNNLITVQVDVLKISGTVAGVITLQGSLDGITYKAITLENAQTVLPTITATDANNTYHFRLSSNPFLFYRVSWTGTGTMAASFGAKMLLRK